MTSAVSTGSSPARTFGFISCKSSSKESVPCFGARRSCAAFFRRVTSPSGRVRKWRASKHAPTATPALGSYSRRSARGATTTDRLGQEETFQRSGAYARVSAGCRCQSRRAA
jgi:hypothetical protein